MASGFTSADFDFPFYIQESVTLNKSASNTIAELQKACQASAPFPAVVYLWTKHFSCGNSMVKDSKGKGSKQQQTKNKQTNKQKQIKKMATHVKELTDKDAQVTIQEIANTLDITSGSVSKILKYQTGYRKACDRWVPQLLTPASKEGIGGLFRSTASNEAGDLTCLDEIITGFRTCTHCA